MNPIANLRKEQGLSQKQIAEELGVRQSTVSQWESGKNLPDILTAQKLALLYGVSIEALLEDVEYPNLLPESEIRHNFLCLTKPYQEKLLEISRDYMKIPDARVKNEK